MASLRTFITIACSFFGSFTGCFAIEGFNRFSWVPFDGWIALYGGTYYRGPLCTLQLTVPNRCFTFARENLNDRVASARWSGLPTTGLSGKAYIRFYSDQGCEGNYATIQLPHFGGIRDFDVQKVKGDITSFMVQRLRLKYWLVVMVAQLEEDDQLLLFPEDVRGKKSMSFYASVSFASRASVRAVAAGPDVSGTFVVPRAAAIQRHVSSDEAMGAQPGGWLRRAVFFESRGYFYYGQVTGHQGTRMTVTTYLGGKVVELARYEGDMYPANAMTLGSRCWSKTVIANPPGGDA
ncbi:hypothetical protein BBJ28_00003464 [Nothophytophthora sp. Chile5]|nr:hypothetical protein BBJ28_00003464 [Nothophytophthora sp. Chile5]